jgi:hypothetical protein
MTDLGVSQEHSAAEDNEEYDYSASGSEDAMDQRSTVTSLCVSQSRTKLQAESVLEVPGPFHSSSSAELAFLQVHLPVHRMQMKDLSNDGKWYER